MISKWMTEIKRKPMNILLLAFPLALWAETARVGEVWVFCLSAVGLVPLAGLLGEATEALAAHTNPRIGGLLNATLGNAAELIITIAAIREGLLELVKASITGSILGNLLLVMGMAFLFGGIKNGIQTFHQRTATRNAILLILAVLALLIPSVLSHSIGADTSLRVEAFSLAVAGVMIVLYVLALWFGFQSHESAPVAPPVAEAAGRHAWSIRTSAVVLGCSTLAVVVLSELLVGAVEPVVESLGVSEFFLGIVLIPLIGNVAEHLVAVTVAMRNQIELSVEITISSSLQIALFVAPVLVFISLFMGRPLQLIFNQFELLALIAGVLITAMVSADGESNWLEGAELLAVYLILGVAFFLLPA